MSLLHTPRRPMPGFTLVEMIVVMVVAGVLAATLTVFLRPAIDGYLVTRERAALQVEAENSLATMVREVRRAVPNSIRTPGNQCVELLPASGGGRYRSGPDTVNDSGVGCTPGANCSAWVDTGTTTTTFDVLSASGTPAAVGDTVVINNQNGNDVYEGLNRSRITAVETPAAVYGVVRLTIEPLQVSPGYDGGRYSIVPQDQQAVFYSCVGADGTLDAQGNGRGQLLRLSGYGYDAAAPTTCPVSGGVVVASGVRACNFVHDPNQGATQQSGFVWIEFEITRHGESAHLSMGAHVPNVP
ncbi:PulJ/GspJ family protein [Sphaerotilus mobilis]|uniref:MSHA biogenesis protein MshO n=1 Tax=Sphaerotilus mobilis TaxID=47994 RepID=A0A4Q7LE45_9BURK|nr:prepilin-type N-terminal cleavage/methylation domain-containing protein [Sphaerotilus mobilis]RZS52221.1 MSHA biogenesis protein MshO [Sphaerotilus mobilis]